MSHWDERTRRPVIACDLGGSKLIVAVVSPDGTLVTHEDFEIGHLPYEQVIATLVRVVSDLSVRYPAAQAVGISAAGNVNRALGTVNFQAVTTEAVLRPVTHDLINPPSCPYQTVPLVDLVTSATQLPVVVENDGNAFVMGEARAGVGRGVDNIVGIPIGTGVGSGVVLNGDLLRRSQSGVALCGMLVVRGEEIWSIGKLASGRGIASLACERAAQDPKAGALRELAARGELTGRSVATLAEKGDAASYAVMTEVRFWLRLLVGSALQMFEPELIVFGGGLMARSSFLLEGMESFLADNTEGDVPPPRLEIAQLGIHASLIGAAYLALDLGRGLNRAATRPLIGQDTRHVLRPGRRHPAWK